MNKQHINQLLVHARDLRVAINKNPNNYTVGLCKLLCYEGISAKFWREVSGVFKYWPEYSQHPRYPVPAPLGYAQPAHEVYGYVPEISAFDNLPKYTGEYGASRLRLLDFVIESLEMSLELQE